MYSQDSIEITGFQNRSITNQFLATGTGAPLAVFLPGFAYSLSAPLFYYSTNLMASLGFDLLGVDYRYSENEDFINREARERAEWLRADANGIYEAIAAREGYDRVLFIGKSLGTTLMYQMISQPLPWSSVGCVWLTPANEHSRIASTIVERELPSLWIAGTNDDYYREEDAHALGQCSHAEVRLIQGADHGLDLAGDAVGSVRQLSEVLDWIRRFVQGRSE